MRRRRHVNRVPESVAADRWRPVDRLGNCRDHGVIGADFDPARSGYIQVCFVSDDLREIRS